MKRRSRAMTLKDMNNYASKQQFADHLAQKAHLTRRAEIIKVTLPKLKFLEKEHV
jgi:hypothetical protein